MSENKGGGEYPYANDPLKPKDDEMAVIRKMEEAVAAHPELNAQLDLETSRWAFLIRFSRGYYYNQFKALPEKERMDNTIRMVCRALEWRQQNKVHQLAGRFQARRTEFDRYWVSGVSGFTTEGRPLYVAMPWDPEMQTKFTKEEVSWMHWQEYEWLANMKAHKMREKNKIILDHVVILDFGDGNIVKGNSVSKSGIDWFRDAIKWEPPGMHEGEAKMDVDGFCYPESLHRLYMINCNMAIRGIWAVAKLFVYPSTREKFRILGSDTKDILKQFADDNLPMAAVPAYLGGGGLNPPGLVLNRPVKKGVTEVYTMAVPAGHSLVCRFNAGKVPITVSGTYTDEAKTASVVFESRAVADKWIEGGQPARQTKGTVEFKFVGGSSNGSIAFEVTALPVACEGFAINQACTLPPATS